VLDSSACDGWPVIEVDGVSKRYGKALAVDDLSFVVRRGHVTGFLGPNGAGKSTTMRLVLGLDRPDAGSVAVNGETFGETGYGLHEVGALIDAKAVHLRRRRVRFGDAADHETRRLI
jgi:ABC-2 type transport system ATP-binding protein